MIESPTAERLLAEIYPGGSHIARISVIGLSKNAGKTVALNHIIRTAAANGVTLGLVSTGRDGEERDAITDLPKPRIWVPRGTWVATAQAALSAGTASVSVATMLPITTPFGHVVIGRVDKPGELLLIGPGTTGRIAGVLDRLEACGATLLLVDGSFDRIAAAAPSVTGHVVLAAGAAYSVSMTETVAQVRHLVDVFDLPPVPPDMVNTAAKAAASAPVAVVGAGGLMNVVPVQTGLGDPDPIINSARDLSDPHVVLVGALGDRLLLALINRRAHAVKIVLPDATHVLVDRNLWRRWRRLGGVAYVQRPIRLMALTTNPHSPIGHDYDPQQFHRAVAELADRPVFDLEAGLIWR